MNSIYASLSILFAEISLILLVICGVLVFLKVRDQRRDKQALAQLTEKLKGAKEDRLNVLSIKLKENHHLEDDELTAAAKEIHNKELDVYITTMNIYADRDSSALESLEGKIRELSEAYSKLSSTDATSSTVPPEEETAEASAETTAEVSEEASELKHENRRMQQELETSKDLIQRLEGELDATKQEMRETVAEFVSAFSGGRDAAEEKMSGQMKEKISSAAQQTSSPKTSGQTADNGTPPATDDETDIAEDEELLLPTEETPPPASTPSGAVERNNVTAESEEQPAEDHPAEENPDDDNPFLSIDDGNSPSAATNSHEEDSSTDRTMDETDLDSDLDIDLEIDLDTLRPETPPAATDSDSGEKGESPEEELDADDIDAILAAGADEKLGMEDGAAITEEAGGIEDISAEDIDAILEDIDITAAEALSDEKKKAEKTA